METQKHEIVALFYRSANLRNIGIATQKQLPSVLIAIELRSKSNTYSALYLSNYAYTQIVDTLKRINGVGNVQILGAEPYSMRFAAGYCPTTNDGHPFEDARARFSLSCARKTFLT